MVMIAAPPSTRRVVARCPRCRGRLLFEHDQHGAYLNCLACGSTLEERAGATAAYAATAHGVWWRDQSS